MKEKKYKVCKDKKLTGRRKVMKEGTIFTLVDFIGDIDVAIENKLCEEFKEKDIENEKPTRKNRNGIKSGDNL